MRTRAYDSRDCRPALLTRLTFGANRAARRLPASAGDVTLATPGDTRIHGAVLTTSLPAARPPGVKQRVRSLGVLMLCRSLLRAAYSALAQRTPMSLPRNAGA